MFRLRSSVLAIAGSLLSVLPSCGGGGGGGGPSTADIQFAQTLDGVWTLTATVESTDCPGVTVGETNTIMLWFQATPDRSELEVREIVEEFVATGSNAPVSQGKKLLNGSLSRAAIAGGRLTLNSVVASEDRSLTLDGFSNAQFATGTITVREAGCTTDFQVTARRDFAVQSTQELAGAWSFDVDQVIGSLPGFSPTVGQTGVFVLQPDTEFSDKFAGAFVRGPLVGSFDQQPITANSNEIERGLGEGGSTDSDLTFRVRFDNAASANGTAVQIDVTDPASGNSATIAGIRRRLEQCVMVPGVWQFDTSFPTTNVQISGPIRQLGCSWFTGTTTGRILASLDASGGADGVFDAPSGETKAFSGSFNAALDTFTSTTGDVQGTLVGSSPGGGGGGNNPPNCATVATGTWTVSGDNGGVSFPGGSLTQSGCTVTFTFAVPGVPQLDTTISGDLAGSQWTPAVTGAVQGVLTDIDVTFSGDPATSFAGTAKNGGVTIDFQGSLQ